MQTEELYQSKIKYLESKIESLKNELKIAEKESAEIKLQEFKNKLSKKYEQFSREEMELIFQLLFGYYLIREFDKTNAINPNLYLNKVAEFLDSWPEEIKKEFKPLFIKFDEYELTMDDQEVIDKVHFYVENSEQLDDDDTENLISIFCLVILPP